MRYVVETSLEDFEAWSGGRDNKEIILQIGAENFVESCIDDMWVDKPPTATDINDYLWFEAIEFIADYFDITPDEVLQMAEEGYGIDDIDDFKNKGE